MNKNKLSQYVDKGYLMINRCLDKPLTIYNYTKQTQFEEYWNEITRQCRGLVLDDNGKVVIKCIPKFFNLGERYCAIVDLTNITISLKEDGYYMAIKDDTTYGLIVTSRGSFDSQMVDAAKKLLTIDILKQLKPDYTYFCELCQNFKGDEGVIVTRHKKPRLVCWAVNNEKHQEVDPTKDNCPFEIARRFTGDEAGKYLEGKVEGVVLRDNNTKARVKVKTEWFREMHRISAHCTRNRVWEIIEKGQAVKDLDIPDEFMSMMLVWEKEITDNLESDYKKAHELYARTLDLTDQEVAESKNDKYIKTLVLMLRKNKIEQLKDLIIRHNKKLDKKGANDE